MYDKIELFLIAVVAVTGLFMAICPKLATKKDMRENAAAVSKTRKGGILLAIVGIIVFVLFLAL